MGDLETTSNSQENEQKTPSNGHSESSGKVNGVSNGYSGDSSSTKHHKSSSHKDKHRDRDRDRDHKKDHKSSRDKDRDKDKDKHSSSKDKDRSKDHKSSNRDKDRDRDRDKDKDKHSSSDKHSSDKHSSSDKHRSKDKDRHHDDKDKKSSSSKDKDHKSSSHSSSRDKDKEHHKSSSSSHDKDKHKHSSSSSKDKDKDRHSSSKDKDKDRSKSSSSKHHSSSSSKDKDRHRSDKDSKRDKDRERDKDKDKSKYENGEKKRESKEIKEEKFVTPLLPPITINEESNPQPIADVDPLDIKNEPEYTYNSQDMSAASSCDYSFSQFNKSEPNFNEYGQKDTSQMMNGEMDDRRNDFDGEDDAEEDGGDRDYNTEEDSQDLQIKEEPQEQDEGSEDDLPLAARAPTPTKRKVEVDDEDEDIPLIARKKVKKEKKAKKRAVESDYDEYDEKPKKKKQKVKKEIKQEIKREPDTVSPKKKKKKDEQEPEVWKWWEEEKKDDGTKWKFLEHKGPVFAPPYDRIPENVKFYYDGKEMRLSEDAEEVAGFYARMLDHDYTSKEVFNNNFFKDWRKTMTDKEKSKITDLKKCNFKPMQAYFLDISEKNRNRTKEEKEKLKQQNADLLEEYGFCLIDGHREKIGNFKIEPPGLFRGRGEHPKMGMLKRRVLPEDVSINCSKDSKYPTPPPGHKWKDVRHDPNVTWLASWTENVQNQVKYVMLNPSSKLKGEKDWQKYETARRLAKSIDKIRKEYREDWKSKEMRIRQRAVALYFIDKLALRAGNEKDEDQADTVGCCSLRVEHISLHDRKDDKECVVVFDFLGKDSIRYYNEVPVEKRVFKNLQLFMENKAPSDDLFDRLNTAVMNKHLNELMEGLTAKVFRTYNASWTLQQQLDELTDPDATLPEKILQYNRANRAVAILCNHQRSVPKGHDKSMEKLKEKIDQKREQISDGEHQVKDAKRAAKGGSVKEQVIYDKKKKMLERLKDQLKKLELQETDRDENKTIALGTSKLNYLDPRISVAWCKKHDVPIEKIYNKTQRDKFRWAIDMATEDYVF